MKKIFLLLIIISLFGHTSAQFNNNNAAGTAQTMWGQVGAIFGGYGVQIKNYFADTSAANASSIGGTTGFLKNIPGIIIRTADDSYWARSRDLQKWNKINAGTGTIPTWQQTLTAGSTLTGANTIAGGGNSFTWNDIDVLTLQTQTPSLGLIQMQGSNITLSGQNSSTNRNSYLYVDADSINIFPSAGALRIDTLNNETSQNTLMGWTTTAGASRGNVGYITLGSGLSLAAGVLSNSGVVSTPTWQQTLTAGSTLSTNNYPTHTGYDFQLYSEQGAKQQLIRSMRDSTLGMYLRNSSSADLAFFFLQGSDSSANIKGGRITHGSGIKMNDNGILNTPYLGLYYIDSLQNLSTQDELLGRKNSTGQVGYITIGTGLSLSSGVLTASSNLTATYLGYGSGSNTLTGDANLTYTAASSAVALDSGYLSFTGSASYGSTVAGSIFRSSSYGLTQRAVAGSAYDWLVFSAAGNSVLANPTGTDDFATGGKFGVGLIGGTISAKLHIAAGSASTAPLKFNSGTNLTTAEAGVMEYNGSNFFLTATSSNRRQVALSNVATPTSGYLLVGNGTDYTITAPSSVTGLPYWALTGTSALTGSAIIDINGNNLDITDGVTTGIISFTPNPTQAELVINGSGKTINAIATSGYFFQSGALQMDFYGAGAATFDASGNITSVSDIRLKNKQGNYSGGLKELMKINPIIYKWKPESGMETKHDYIGFSAQNIRSSLGEDAIGINKQGYLSIQDRAILAVAINAIQELKELNDKQQKEIDNLKQIIKNK